jgi:hypothetical protein
MVTKSSLPVELLMMYLSFGRVVNYGIYSRLKRRVPKTPLLDINSHVFQSTRPAESAIKPDQGMETSRLSSISLYGCVIGTSIG